MVYQKHLSKDAIMKKLIREHGVHTLEIRKNILMHLCTSIMGQQLHTKVAAVLRNRFMNLFGGKNPSAKKILNIPDETLRGIGLSNAKVQYIKNVCHFFIDNKLTDSKIHKLDDLAFIALVTQIKGVGKWTAEMLLMFAMGRQDIFSLGDLGLQKAILKHYQPKYKTRKELEKKLLHISESWKPYRTYACIYLWRSLDAKPELD